MIIFYVLAIIILSFVLIKATDLTILALKRLSELTKLGSFVLSALLLAIGTSFPEMSVAITSAIQGANNISVGNVIGANIANTSLVLGLAGLSVGTVYVRGEFFFRDVWIAMVAGLAPLVLISDGVLTRPDGIILIAIYFAYAISFFKKEYKLIAKDIKIDKNFYKFLRKINLNFNNSTSRNIFRLLVGLFLMLFSAYFIVFLATKIASFFNIPLFIVGLIIISLGTTLPELTLSFRSLREHESGIFFGNILGSIIANSTLVVGITTIIRPVTMQHGESYFKAFVFFIILGVLVWYFAKSKRRIDWWESFLLVLIYVIFVIVEIV